MCLEYNSNLKYKLQANLHDPGNEEDLLRRMNIQIYIIAKNLPCIFHILGEIQKKVDVRII